MEFIEYPKAVYNGEESRIVADAIEEAAARVDGFLPYGEHADEAPAPRARKPKRNVDAEAE